MSLLDLFGLYLGGAGGIEPTTRNAASVLDLVQYVLGPIPWNTPNNTPSVIGCYCTLAVAGRALAALWGAITTSMRKGRHRQLLRPWPLLRRPAIRAQRAQSPHWGERPDPRRQGAAFPCLEDR